ncbi:MAG: primase-helicase zinc-binding domain-containing protein, partial [Desulfuromonadales bacterium]
MTVFDLYQRHGLTARKVSGHKGGEYHGPCPGCGGEDRFHLWPEQDDHGTFWCRQCGKGGDAIQFLRDFAGMGFREACAALGVDVAARPEAGTPCPRRSAPRWQPDEIQPPAEIWQEKARAFVAWCHDRLLDNGGQLQWLADRGVDLEAVKVARLGWNPGEAGKDIWRPRESWGLPEEVKESTGKPKRLWLPQGLVIPCLDRGAVIRIRIRRPEGEPRYYVVPGSSRSPFYLRRDRRVAVVVESELDALAV